MEEIIPNLWISNLQTANDLIQVSSKNIKVIVNCSKNYNTCIVDSTYRVPVSASSGETFHECELLYKYLDSAVNFIHTKLMNKNRVLVCCPTGKQQSATVIAAYMMKYGKIKLNISCNYLYSKKKDVFKPEFIFSNSLEMYQKYLN